MEQQMKGTTVRDPVCSCKVDTAGAEFKTEFEGKTYYFCTEACKRKFDMSPGQWVKDIERGKPQE